MSDRLETFWVRDGELMVQDSESDAELLPVSYRFGRLEIGDGLDYVDLYAQRPLRIDSTQTQIGDYTFYFSSEEDEKEWNEMFVIPQVRFVKYIKELGKGQFSRVFLGTTNASNKPLALKVTTRDQQAVIDAEKEAYRNFNNPFIVKADFCLVRNMEEIFGIEYVEGGDLYQRIMDGPISDADVRLYASEILLALEYIHYKGYVYRDLKPENILICGDGHVKLADFGFVKYIEDTGKTHTFCGTVNYMAPEVIKREEYGFEADIWAFGVLVFEMLLGYPPYYSENQAELMDLIIANEIEFDDDADYCLVEFFNTVMKSNPKERPSWEKIKELTLFEGIDWMYVEEKLYLPEYIPTTESIEAKIEKTTPRMFGSMPQTFNVPGFEYTCPMPIEI